MTLLLVFGPPAVGKMTVGRAVADASGFRLFHNHHTIEPLLDVFDFGTPPFNRLLGEFRQRVLEEAAAADTDLVFTLVWALDLPEDAAAVRTHLQPFVDAGRRDRPRRAVRRAGHPPGPQPHAVPARREEVEARPGVVRRPTCASSSASR